MRLSREKIKNPLDVVVRHGISSSMTLSAAEAEEMRARAQAVLDDPRRGLFVACQLAENVLALLKMVVTNPPEDVLPPPEPAPLPKYSDDGGRTWKDTVRAGPDDIPF